MTILRQVRVERYFSTLIAFIVVATTVYVGYGRADAAPGTGAPASGTISGRVFRDFAIDGIFEAGVDGLEAGIEVRAYDDAGNEVGPATTDTDGEYSINLAGLEETSTDQYRVEFTIPSDASYLRNGYLGDDNAGPVQFASAYATDVDFAVHNPAQFCDNNPELAVNCWVNGDPNGGGNAEDFDALVTIPWNGFGTTADLNQPTNPAHIAFNNQIGTTWGMAYQRATDTLFVGAAQRRHSGFGPGGTGAIYRINPDGSGYSQFLDLNALGGVSTGADPHTGLPVNAWDAANPASVASHDPASFDAVGKIALGDIDISEDDQTLWAVNLNDRTLLEIPIGLDGVVPPPGHIKSHDIAAGAPACTNGQFRPFALSVRDGQIFVGGVCSGETGGTVNDVVAHVLTHDPNGADGNFTTHYSLPMNYRTSAARAGTECAVDLTDIGGTFTGCSWEPWRADWSDGGFPEGPNGPNLYVAPQPMLTDIEIDADGSLVLGFADRFGMQSGFNNYQTDTGDFNTYMGATAGDLVRVCNVNGSLTFPCRPDGTEFYSGDNAPDPSFVPFNVHPESAWGGTSMLFREGEVAISMADPLNVWSGGIGWMDKSTGLISEHDTGVRRYEVFAGYDQANPSNPNINGIGKATGLGDLEIICDAAPLEIGDRVWFDRNGNGRQDPSEPALPGVGVRLLDENDVEIGASVTNSSGVYSFNSLIIPELISNANFSIVFDESTADVSGIDGLADVSILEPTTQNAAGTEMQHDSNIDAARTLTFTTGAPGANDYSLDAGFRGGLQIGNLVWFDLDNNGDADDDEPVIAGLTLNLFREDGAAGFDGTEALVESQTTDTEGFYSFRNLIDGETYYVAIPEDQSGGVIEIDGQALDALTLLSSTGTATNPIDNNDDGTPFGDFLAVTNAIVVSDDPASEPTDETDTPPDPDTDSEEAIFVKTDHQVDDDDSNLTFDLGFIQNGRVGNLVWLDGKSGEPGFNNGIADPAESDYGLGGVTVELYSNDGAVNTFVTDTTTDDDGRYWFSNLEPGTYVIAIPAGQTGQTLEGETIDIDDLFVSSPAASDADEGFDDLNDGTVDTGNGFASVSSPFDIDFTDSPSDEQGDFEDTTEDAAEVSANTATSFVVDEFSDLTVDFSFVEQPTFSIGNLVWIDDDDGIAEDGEPGIENVAVELWADGGTEAYDTTTTDDEGHFLFEGLPAGDFFVVVPGGQTGQLVDGNPIDLTDLPVGSDTDLTPNNDEDNDNNGAVGVAASHLEDVATELISVGEPDPFEPSEPTDETLRSDDPTDDDNSSVDDTSNLSVDIAFVMPLRVGNIVWLDNGGGAPGDATYNPADENDGEADATERGIPGVLVQLMDDDDVVVAEAVTDEGGRYVFDELLTGTFRVGIPTNQTPVIDLDLTPDPAALFELLSSQGQSATPEASDDDDDGEPYPGFASLSAQFELDFGAEAEDEQGNFNSTVDDEAEADVNDDFPWLPDGNSNLEIDFGFAPTPMFVIGNLLWEDFDNDGIADNGEPGISGALVQLLDGDGVVIAETTTDEDGHYRFVNIEEGTYSVSVPADQQPTLGPVLGLDPDALDGLEISDTVVADPDDPASIDNDHNGVDSNGDATSGPISVGEGDSHSEPTGESLRSDDPASDELNTDRGDRTDLTVDFGFWRGLRLGNQVWLDGVQGEDGYDNGIMESTEAGIGGVTVELWIDNDDDGDAEPDGDDGVNPEMETITDDEGNYWFEHLDEDVAYFVVIPSVPDGFSSTGQSGDPVTSDNDDDGAPNGGNAAVSDVVTLTAGGTSTDEADSNPAEDAEAEANTVLVETVPDANSELLVDFGFIEVPVFRLGNQVWNDLDADGLADSDESGIAGVLVQLTANDGTVIAETATDENGMYSFDNLAAGQYMVVIPASQTPALGAVEGLVAAALDGFVSSATEEADPNDDVDNNDNGVLVDDVWKTANILLGPDPVAPPFGAEPTNEVNPFTAVDDDPDQGEEGSYPDDFSNFTVDFGFTKLTLGNQIWSDVDADGVVDPDEPGINGVVVQLFKVDPGTGELSFVESTVTVPTADGDGFYVFDGLEEGAEYVVQVPASEFAEGGPLDGLFSSPDPDPVVDPNTGGDDDNGIDNDDNGIDPENFGDSVQTAGVVVSASDEPINENPDGDLTVHDPNTNLTVDLGFAGLAVGDTVWADDDGDGTINGDESGIADVVVELWLVDEDGEPVGESPFATTTTAPDGTFLFGSLVPGTFKIVLPQENFVEGGPLEGMTSTIGNGVVAPAVDDDATDSDDNGNVDPDGLTISTAPFALAFGDEPTGETGEPGSVHPTNTNLTVDLGLVDVPPMSIGNQVWMDVDNSGVLDGDEVGVADVVVELWAVDADGNPVGDDPAQTVTTDEEGNYLFVDVAPGQFIVVIPSVNFDADEPLEGMFSSAAVVASDPDDDVDGDDQGFDPAEVGADVVSEPVTLIPSLEPLDESTGAEGHGQVDGVEIADANSNLTLDFGFFPLGVGNRVFFDADNSGTFDEGETGFAGVEVTLQTEDGELVATTVTDEDGYYLFGGFNEGDYVVVLGSSNFEDGGPLDGYHSSTGNGVAPDPDELVLDNDDNGDPVDGAGSAIVTPPITLNVQTEPTAEVELDVNEDHDIPVDANSDSTVDFGLYTADIVTTLWTDTNNNGEVDEGETPLAGVIVELLNEAGEVIATTVSDENGLVTFTGLEEGTYRLKITVENFEPGGALEGLTSTTGLNGVDAGIDPDGDDRSVISGLFEVTAGDNPELNVFGADSDAAFGFTPTGSVGDFVWDDLDGDGLQDPNEPGLPDVEINVFRVDPETGEPSQEPVHTVTTDSDGAFEVDDLPPGEFIVDVETPAGTDPSPKDQGGDDTLDSDIKPDGRTDVIQILAGEKRADVDAGFVTPSSGSDAASDLGTPPNELAFTGSNLKTLMGVSTMLILAGVVLGLLTCRRRTA